jgi:NTP pyrophosphatase (non-canonical NTP hydrolase)
MTYREEVMRTAAISLDTSNEETKYSLGGMGLSGEAGEVTDLLKKYIHHNDPKNPKPLNKEKLIEELGDVRWYMEYLALVAGFTMEDIEKANISKLRIRYPKGFTPDDAIKRVDQQSQAV